MLMFFYVQHPQGIGNPDTAWLVQFFQNHPTLPSQSMNGRCGLMDELLYLGGKKPAKLRGQTVVVLAEWHFAYPHTKVLWVGVNPTEEDMKRPLEIIRRSE